MNDNFFCVSKMFFFFLSFSKFIGNKNNKNEQELKIKECTTERYLSCQIRRGVRRRGLGP